MASYQKDPKTAQLAKAFQAQKNKEESAQDERKNKLEECKIEMDDFILWVEKSKNELGLGTMQTIISQRVLNPLTKKKEE